MNEQRFRELLQQVPDDQWQAVAQGQGLLLVDDQELAPGPADAPNLIIRRADDAQPSAAELQARSLADAGTLLADYYRTHPLTQAGFNRQAAALIRQHGAEAFAAPEGQLPRRTLFVDGGELVAEASDSPRHRYGAFCELERPMPSAAVVERVKRWLEWGEAHQRYLGMNVCRYNC